jgi:hypothetical protein
MLVIPTMIPSDNCFLTFFLFVLPLPLRICNRNDFIIKSRCFLCRVKDVVSSLNELKSHVKFPN